MQNTKIKIVYSLRVHIKLQKLGFNYLTEMKNPQFPKLNCWVYENTPEFDLAFESLMKEADGNGR